VCGRFGRIFGTRLYEKLEEFVLFYLYGVEKMRPNRPWMFSEGSGKHASGSSGGVYDGWLGKSRVRVGRNRWAALALECSVWAGRERQRAPGWLCESRAKVG